MIPPDDQLMSLEKPSLITQLKGGDAAYESVVVERDALATERDALATERDALATERDALTTERDALATERDALATERDGLAAELLTLRIEIQRLTDLIQADGDSQGKRRYANPHSKERTKAFPKKPGRKRGVGLFTNRKAPQELPGDQIILAEAPLPQTSCTHCGTDLEISEEQATTIDTPKVPRRVITKWRREIGICPDCGIRHLGEHPNLPATQTGATAHRVGPNVMTYIEWMHYGLGVSLRRSVNIASQITGITLTQSAVTQDAERKCGKEGPVTKVYSGMVEDLRKESYVNTDDTGWAIGVRLAFVMGFFTNMIKLYFIRYQHRSNEVLEILGRAFRGVLITDRGSSYDANILDWIRMQKCLSHLLKNIKMAMVGKEGVAREFGDKLSELLREAIRIWHQYRDKEVSRKEFAALAEDLHTRMSEHLRNRVFEDADAQRLLDGIGMRHDNGQLLLFLKDPKVSPTNNMAERDLRGAVISRKNSQCSKNERGADTFAKMKSIFATLQARKLDLVTGFQEVMRTEKMLAPLG